MLEARLKNKNLRRLITTSENVDALEYLLEQNANQMKALNATNLDLGQIPARNKIPEMFYEAKEFADNFNGIDPSKQPKFGQYSECNFINASLYGMAGVQIALGLTASPVYLVGAVMYIMMAQLAKTVTSGSHYNPLFNKVIVQKTEEKKSKIHLVHEYAHFLQHHAWKKNPFALKSYEALQEGHSIGIEKHAGIHWAQKHKDPAYLLDNTERNVSDFKSEYIFMAGIKKKKINKTLLRDPIFKNKKAYKGCHSLGNIAYSIAELKHGTGIYKKTLEQNFDFI